MELRECRSIHWWFVTEQCYLSVVHTLLFLLVSSVDLFCVFKVLLPLVNAPMIDYTLAWLESAGVEEVFVFCCAHSKQVIDYLENSEWFGQPNFSVTTIESYNSTSAGDALRLIYERHVVCWLIFLLFLYFIIHNFWIIVLNCRILIVLFIANPTW